MEGESVWDRVGRGLKEGRGVREVEGERLCAGEAVALKVEEGEVAGERVVEAHPLTVFDATEVRLAEAHLLTTALPLGVRVTNPVVLPRGDSVGTPTDAVGNCPEGVWVVVVDREEEGVTPTLTEVFPLALTERLAVRAAVEEGVSVPSPGESEGEGVALDVGE